MEKQRPPEHIRDRLDLGFRAAGHSFEFFQIYPPLPGRSKTVQHGLAKVTFVRTRDEWRLYWMRADLKWHSYDPEPIHSTLESALKTVAQDRYNCFYG